MRIVASVQKTLRFEGIVWLSERVNLLCLEQIEGDIGVFKFVNIKGFYG